MSPWWSRMARKLKQEEEAKRRVAWAAKQEEKAKEAAEARKAALARSEAP